MDKIKFGTDGWRAGIAADYTFDNVRRVSQGFATYLKPVMGNRRNVLPIAWHPEVRNAARLTGSVIWRRCVTEYRLIAPPT